MAESGGKNLSVTSSVVGDESNPPFSGWLGRRHQFPDDVEDRLELRVVFLFQSGKFECEIGMRCKYPAKPHKGTHYFDVDHDGALAVEDAGKHGHTLFGEGLRQVASAAPT